jgi:zinc-binding alcohol dehydrogenase family protein
MRAVGYTKPLPIDDPEALLDLELPRPTPSGRDLLVKVEAVSVNPVDVKVRMRAAPEPGQAKILGWDAAGVVAETGRDCSLFKPGDQVWYAGSILLPGTNAEYHLVDERIAGTMPRLAFAAAAALPLTAITAWELLFDRFALPMRKPRAPQSLLIIGGAGGVGSIMIQLARRLTGLTIVATASRPETQAWCRELGAHHVIDHSQPLGEQLRAIALPAVDVVAGLTQTERHLPAIAEVIAPQGRFGLIDDPRTLDITPFKRKSVSVHWEAMFTRPIFAPADMIAQHDLLCEVARLVDDGLVRSTATEQLGPIDAASLRRAHAMVESGRMRGKVVVAGFAG